MKNLNPLKIGKYTFWVSFGIGNLFLLGYLFGAAIKSEFIANVCLLGGYYYLYVATAVNLAILLALLVFGIFKIRNAERKQCFVGSAIMLINIPLAILYAFVGLGLVTGRFGFFVFYVLSFYLT